MNPIRALFNSRKAILAFLGILATVVMFAFDLISADQLAQHIQYFVVILIAAIAGEDMALKFGAKSLPSGD